jgi:hypothetical protein
VLLTNYHRAAKGKKAFDAIVSNVEVAQAAKIGDHELEILKNLARYVKPQGQPLNGSI